ncbi:bile acid:sodium symporter family protein [Methylocystis bryophila]|uniref:bile acid:sodium symporter family protein n=1 Tax=Methylocystis bryophila TaxID=655015 RepID=UPI000A271A06|nr:bile acid:sodium symporter [Methylocystis bryophila]
MKRRGAAGSRETLPKGAGGIGTAHAVAALQHAIHRYFIWLILSSYVLAAVFPGLGLYFRSAELGAVSLPQGKIAVSLPPLMLAFLLFNAGLGVRTAELSSLLRKPGLLLAGAATNVAAPLAFIASVSLLLASWSNADETQRILAGLALVASMPIAGTSTAWAQNANGNLALSLGLILLSTLCSPILSPLALHAAGFLTTGDYSEDLHELAQSSAGSFLGVWVILPSLLGIATHKLLGERRAASLSPYMKIINSVVLLLLNYSNASLSLPSLVAQPDFDYLAVMVGVVVALCFSMFAAGYLLSRAFRTERAAMASLMFGLGMNNNGAGLVLASLELTDHPGVMLPIICYNLVQHFGASLADRLIARGGFSRPHEERAQTE